MRNVKRYFSPGQIYFVTHIAYGRRSILTESFPTFRRSLENHQQINPYELIAWVVLPDHWHALINPKTNNMASLMKKVKLSFSSYYRKQNGLNKIMLWQNRYWDHIIRNQNDFNRHIDYIHYNPVKHGLVRRPIDYQYSSFIDYYKRGVYEPDWGLSDIIDTDGEFDE
jgi:putative transposase